MLKQEPNELLTTDEVADMLRRKPQTIRLWRWQGQGPRWFKMGEHRSARVLYRRSEVERWVAELEAKSHASAS